MPEQLLDRADAVPALKQMGGERMAEGVAGCGLGDAGPAGGVPDSAPEYGLVQVVPRHV